MRMKLLSAAVAAVSMILPASEGRSERPKGEPGSGQYSLSYQEGRVTVYANEADAESLLREFSEKSGIAFNKFTAKSQRLTLALDGVSVEDFLNKVLGSYVARSKKTASGVRISSVTIMDEGGGNQPLPPEPPPPPEAQPPPESPVEPVPGEQREETERLPLRERRKRSLRRRRPRALHRPAEPSERHPEIEEGQEPPPEPSPPPQ